jgi:hypothetical protein
MAGDIKGKYPAASTTMTTTNLQSLASSQTYIGGWGSAAVDNSSNVYLDYAVGATFKTASANRQATGVINVYVIGSLKDSSTFGTVASGTAGTEGAITFTDTFRQVTQCRLLQSIFVGESGSATIYDIPMTGIAQLFGGICPIQWYLYVAQNVTTTTTAGLASSGNAVYYTPIIAQYT